MAEVTIAHLTEVILAEGEQREKRDNKQISELATLNKSFAQYFKSMANQAGDKLEERREKAGGKIPTKDEFSGAIQGFKDASGMGLMGFLGAIGSALTGLAVGLTTGFGQYLLALGQMFDNLTGKRLSSGFLKVTSALRTGLFKMVGLTPDGKLGPNLTKLMSAKNNVILRIRTTMSGISKSIYAMVGLGVDGKPVTGTSNFMKRMFAIGKAFRGGLTNIGNMFRPLATLIGGDSKAVGGIFKSISSGIKSFLSAFKIFGGTFQALKGALNPIFTVFKGLGRVIFAPLTAILAVVDAIKGAIAGYQKEGILGGILGAIGGVFGGLIGMPLDLLKSAISWIAGKLGFENFSELLDSFSFKDGIMDLFMGIASVFNGAIDWVKNAIGGVANKIASFGDMIFDAIMFPFRAVMSLFDGEEGNMFSDLGASIIEGIKNIFKKIKDFVVDKFKGVGRAIANFFTGGDDDIEPPTKEIKDGQVVAEVEKVEVQQPEPRTRVRRRNNVQTAPNRNIDNVNSSLW
jgi:hypothetical protein